MGWVAQAGFKPGYLAAGDDAVEHDLDAGARRGVGDRAGQRGASGDDRSAGSVTGDVGRPRFVRGERHERTRVPPSRLATERDDRGRRRSPRSARRAVSERLEFARNSSVRRQDGMRTAGIAHPVHEQPSLRHLCRPAYTQAIASPTAGSTHHMPSVATTANASRPSTTATFWQQQCCDAASPTEHHSRQPSTFVSTRYCCPRWVGRASSAWCSRAARKGTGKRGKRAAVRSPRVRGSPGLVDRGVSRRFLDLFEYVA